jgi:hypothetical protein
MYAYTQLMAVSEPNMEKLLCREPSPANEYIQYYVTPILIE